MKYLNKHKKKPENTFYFELTEQVELLKKTNYDDKSGEVKAWLQSNINAIPVKQKNTSMRHFFVYYRHGIRLAFSIVLLALFIAAGNIPLSYNTTVGYILNWNVKKENYSEKIFERYEWMNNNQVVTSLKNVNGVDLLSFKLIVNDEKTYENYEKDLKNEKSVLSYEVQPINRSGARSLFQRVLNIFIRVDAGNKSVEEAGEELSAQFNAAGYKNSRVVVKQGPSGKKYLFITIPIDRSIQSMPPEKPPYLEIEVANNGNLRRFVTPEMRMPDSIMKDMPPPMRFGDRFAGKSDSEIKQQIKEDVKKFHNENINDKDIEVIRINGKVVFAKLNNSKFNDPPLPGPPPMFERNIDEADRDFIRKEIFPDGGPGRFFKRDHGVFNPDSLMKNFPEEIISVLVEK
ncbi:MAG: hypothetical protein PHN88_00255 [Ignavibacteria bacterium]|nr:hypothetical protein [Ignavibacteria bacterium]